MGCAPDWLTVKEYAAQMRVTEECVRVWLRKGYLAGQKTLLGAKRAHWRVQNPQPRVSDSTSAHSQTTAAGVTSS